MAGDPTEPGRVEVVAWMARQPQPSAIEAVRHFFPGISPEAQQEKAAIYRVWWQRAKAAGQVSQSPPSPQGAQHRTPAPGVDVPDPPPNLAELDDEAYRVWQLEYMGMYLRACKRDVRQAMAVLEQMSRARTELEDTRRKQGATVKLDPTPSAVAKEIADESKAIRLLLEALEATKAAGDAKENSP